MNRESKAGASAASKFDRLFNRDKFRRRAMKFYRVAGPLVLAYFAVYLLYSAGVFGPFSADDLPRWLLTLYALLTLGVAFATPVLFVLATVGGMALRSEWRFAGPLWLFSAAAGLFLVTVFFVRQLTLEDQRQVWNIASALLLASAAWATAIGWRSRS